MVIGLQPLRLPRIFPTCDICHEQTVMHAIEWRDAHGILVKKIRACSLCTVTFEAGDELDFAIVPISTEKAA